MQRSLVQITTLHPGFRIVSSPRVTQPRALLSLRGALGQDEHSIIPEMKRRIPFESLQLSSKKIKLCEDIGDCQTESDNDESAENANKLSEYASSSIFNKIVSNILSSEIDIKELPAASFYSRIAKLTINGTNYGIGFLFEDNLIVTTRKTFPSDATSADLTFLCDPNTIVQATVLCSANHCTTLRLISDTYEIHQESSDKHEPDASHVLPCALNRPPIRIKYSARLECGDEVKLMVFDEEQGPHWIDATFRQPGSTLFTVKTSGNNMVPIGTPVINKNYEVIGIVKTCGKKIFFASYLDESDLKGQTEEYKVDVLVGMLSTPRRQLVEQELVKQPDSWRKIAIYFFINPQRIINKAGDDELARCRALIDELSSKPVSALKRALITRLDMYELAQALGPDERVYDPFRSRLKLNP